jgi:hypothetical protein
MSAKLTYINGSWLTPSALNGYFGTTAATGHVHDGGGDATCAPLIDASICLTGMVPSTSLYLADSSFICPMRAVGGGATVNVVMHYVKETYGTVKMWWEDITGLQSDIVHKSTTPLLNTYSLTPAYQREVTIKVDAFGGGNIGSFVPMTDGYLVLAGSATTGYVSQVVEYKL